MTNSPIVYILRLVFVASLAFSLAVALYWLIIAPPAPSKHVNHLQLRGLQAMLDTGQGCTPDAKLQALINEQSRRIGLSLSACGDPRPIRAALAYLNNLPADQAYSLLKLPAQQQADRLALRDPFRLPGCLYLTSPDNPNEIQCPLGHSIKSLAGAIPHASGLDTSLLQYLDARAGVSPIPLAASRIRLIQGRSLSLTLEPPVQAAAQDVVACYTGDLAACQKCPECTPGAEHMREDARARMLGALVVNLADGAIIAAASAHTPSYRATSATHSLSNHALFGEAMPASILKLLELAASDGPLASDDATLQKTIQTSDTEAVLDEVLCRDADFKPECIQGRLARIHQLAAQIGWGRTPESYLFDLNTAGSIAELNWPVLFGRLFSDTGGVLYGEPGQASFRQEAIRDCYRNGQKNRWRRCQGEAFNNTLAELFGQGNTRATPVGVAQLLLALHSASLGNEYFPRIHLVAKANGQNVQPARSRLSLAPGRAQALLAGMATTHLPGGTTHSACLRAGGGRISCDEKTVTNLLIAGKTGTPLFPHDTLTYDQRQARCQVTRGREAQLCALRPIKWYAGVTGKQGTGYRHAIVVLAERNYDLHGRLDNAKELGPNVAAEVAMHVAKRLNQVTPSVSEPLNEKRS